MTIEVIANLVVIEAPKKGVIIRKVLTSKRITKMSNPYYFFFYILTKFFDKIHTKYSNPSILSSVSIMSICIILNIEFIQFLLENTGTIKPLPTPNYFLALSVVLLIMGINYLYLIRKGKATKIISYYDTIFETKKINIWSILAWCFYIIFTFSGTFYLAYLDSNHFKLFN